MLHNETRKLVYMFLLKVNIIRYPKMRSNRKTTCGILLLLIVTSGTLFVYFSHVLANSVRFKKFQNGTLLNMFYKNINVSKPNINSTFKILNSVKCETLNMSLHFESVDTWQSLNRDKLAFVFSAYFIHESKTIVIIGMKARYSFLHYCQFWYNGKGSQPFLAEEIVAKITIIPEGHGQPYSAVLFECSFNPNSTLVPTYVSLVTKNCTVPSNLLLIRHVHKPETVVRNFTVCLSPLYGYPNVYELVEWFELNRILGAEMFYVYNYSSDSNVEHVLDFYSKKGLTTIVQWRLPNKEDSNETIGIHYFGQVAALNDCLYRNKYNSKFIANLDLDEFIIPHSENGTTWIEMLNEMNHDADAYIFRNTFFKKEWDNADIEIPNKMLVNKYQLVTLQKVQHEKKIFIAGLRSKYFARTLKVSSVMIHTVPGVFNRPVPADVALVHHYRDVESKNDPENERVLDKTVPLKFGDELIQNVQNVWSELNKTISN